MKVEQLLPELVMSSGPNATKALAYQGIIPVVVEAVKELDIQKSLQDEIIQNLIGKNLAQAEINLAQAEIMMKQETTMGNLVSEMMVMSARLSLIEKTI